MPCATNLCPSQPQFPLNFGDGTIDDVTIDMIDAKSDLSAFVFGTSTGYYAYTTTTTLGGTKKQQPGPIIVTPSNAPLVGLYVASNPSVTLSYLSWLKYFTSTSFTTTVTINALALSSDDSKVIVGFGPVFMVATVDIATGQVMYSGASTALSTDLTIASQGVGHTLSNPFTIQTSASKNSFSITKFSTDYSS